MVTALLEERSWRDMMVTLTYSARPRVKFDSHAGT